MSGDNTHKQQTAMAAYMSVRHLATKEAAAVLGLTRNTVNGYRRTHPECAPAPVPAAHATHKPRPGIVQHTVLMVEPSRSASVCAERVMHVSLPAPPWEGGFDRTGARA